LKYSTQSCELCGSNGYPFQKKSTFTYFKCKKCKYLFLHPVPSQDLVTSLYVNSNSESDEFDKKNLKLGKNIIQLLGTESGKALLDIGCQNGALLQLLRKNSRLTLHAVEPSIHNFDIVKKIPSINITHGFFDADIYKDVTFDLVNLGDVIEHLENPKGMIKDINKILRPKGHLVVTTPITNCAYVKLSNFVKRLLPGFPLSYLTPPHHLKYFSSSNLDDLLTDNGFEKIESWYSGQNFKYELGSSEILLNGFKGTLLRLANMRKFAYLAVFLIIFSLTRALEIFPLKGFSYSAVYKKNV